MESIRRPKPSSESSDKTALYLSVVNASRDEGETVGKRRFSAFKRRQDHLQRRSPRRDMARFCQSTILQSGHSSLHIDAADDLMLLRGGQGYQYQYQEKGETDKAIKDYSEAIRLNPDQSVAYFNRGIMYRNKGDKAKAMAYLLKARAIRMKRLGPEHPNTKLVQTWIDSLNKE